MTDFVETKETSFTYIPEKVETFLYEMLSDFSKQLGVTYTINDDKSITFFSNNSNYLQECYDQLYQK